VLSRAEIARHAQYASGGQSALHTIGIEHVKSQVEAALAAAPFYEKAEILPEGKAGPMVIEASKLQYRQEKMTQMDLFTETAAMYPMRKNSPLDTHLERAGLEPADFGTLVHGVLEGRLNGHPPTVPARIDSRLTEEKTRHSLLAIAETMADKFLSSSLGKRWAASNNRESEFSVITSVKVKEKAIAISGQIDLIFEEADEAVVVDFKTDRVENPEDHFAQLAAYRQAAGDIFGKPASVWLYYLRSGNTVNITNEVKIISLEELMLK
jgi:ATP-dependent helicase/nuclease subunit A